MLTFREATPNDLPQLLQIEQYIVEAERPFNTSIKPGNPTYYNMEQLVTSNDAYLIVAEDSGNIIGTGYAQIRESKDSLVHDQHSYLGFMYVDPEYRGKGINQDIMDQLVAWSKDRDIHDLYLDVYAQNDAAIRAYQKAGFAPCLIEMKLSVE